MKGGFQYQTANGVLRILSADAFENDIGPLTDRICKEDTPSIAGMDFASGDLNALMQHIIKSDVDHRAVENCVVLTDQCLTANTIMRFFERQ